MTVSSTNNRNDYTGSASLIYPYTCGIFADSDLEVYVNDVLQTLTTDYTVSGAGTSGGNVTFVASVNGKAIAIVRNVASTQPVDLVANGPFNADTVETALDRATILAQQNEEALARALKFAKSSTQSDVTVADLVAASFLRANATADGIEMANIATLGNVGIPVSIAQGGTGQVTALAALNALGMPTTYYLGGTGLGNYTTTNLTGANLVNVDGTNLLKTLTVPVGWKLSIRATFSAFNTVGGADETIVALVQDGTTVRAAMQTNSASVTGNQVLEFVHTGDGASHSWSLQFVGVTGGTSTIVNGTISGITTVPLMTLCVYPSN